MCCGCNGGVHVFGYERVLSTLTLEMLRRVDNIEGTNERG